ncbi:MAG: DnaJ domain-containing protein [Polyangiaceae bacterium]
MATTPHSRLPRLVEGIDLRELPIGPAEAFVLSHVNGDTDESEIADEAGLAPETVSATLEALARLGAIWFDEPARRESNRSPRPVSHVTAATRIGPVVEASALAAPQHPAAQLYDLGELEEDVEIPVERRRLILDAFYRLESMTHYQLLNVEPTADKRAIKNAYFEVVNLFHPDRYFGKRLGSYKSKLERVFTRLTEAHDALTRIAPRAAYDVYLASLHKTRALDQPNALLVAQVRAIQQQIEDEARAAEALLAPASPVPYSAPDPSLSPVPERFLSPQPSASPSSGSQPRLQSQRPPDADARKRALARKLGGRQLSGPMSAVVPSAPASSDRAEASARAAEELKRRYEARVRRAREDQAERYLVNARQSLTSKDPISAANALRIAASLVPDNQEMLARLNEAQNLAESLLSSHYLAQAQYEEREGRMAEAARSYARATAGSPDARTFERAAYCALMADGDQRDLRLAGEHARRAVAIGPDDVQSRVTMARIYVAAGMKQSGLAEFERAATLAPKDDTIRDWIQRLKRGEA